MTTETTDIPDTTPRRGWVLYDGSCGMCTAGVRRVGRIVERRGFELVPLQADWVVARLKLRPDELMREMRVLTADGRLCGGVDALVYLARAVWWAWPFYLLARVPGVVSLLRPIYRLVARHRHAIGGTCPLPETPHRVAEPREVQLGRISRLAVSRADRVVRLPGRGVWAGGGSA